MNLDILGNENLVEGPKNLFTSRCCILSEIKYEGGQILASVKKDNTLACRRACRNKSRCKWFTYNTEQKDCVMMKGKPAKVTTAANNWLAGPPNCSRGQNACRAYGSI